ncbi:hypothetical protein HGI47_18485 [Novosphingobium sp. ERN07]|uniref:hypothetical protein n=1 Tax=Novosphingobium sp. ERN07 TaxID=2726187 RepID=UPI0014576539|nr:hypothetical protein [Novosphingobium sp. ERN07]NLR72867.1 hypothetical protein [Novosphingobium sp. ERN07]
MRDLIEHLPDRLKQLLDALSLATVLGNLISMLPAIATILPIIWWLIRIYETPTVQGLLKRQKKDETP